MSLNAYFLYFCLNFIEKIMRKVLAIAFIGSLLVVNCSKKPDHTLQDSNTMLEEPETTTVVDSTAKKAAPAAATTPASATPEAAKTDSTAAKK
ncbi:hypothetical protein SAMN05421639_102172 [Chryseobacterium shigense]|uniref:Uncharacterized protein n=2 Tax=Chryseobacterium shigense TaxID=297244 RepID=A0A1N7I5J1_9FLAO|nr:hypothetical protein SAMN05421639_102172 [Chryseobacterium shigense]